MVIYILCKWCLNVSFRRKKVDFWKVSTWLEGVEFILPRRLSSAKIVYTICLINEGDFPVTDAMSVIFKVSVKWLLPLKGIPFNETPMGWFVIVKSRSKTFSTTCVLFSGCFAWKWIHNIAGTTVQVIWFNAIFFSLGTEKSKCFGSHNMFAFI